jgi:AraC-like DNA-binding protein
MPSGSAHAYTDPDDYAASVQAATMTLTLAARGDFHAQRISIKLHHLWLQSFSETLPRVAHWANHPGRAIISFRTQPGPRLLSAGLEMGPSSLIRRREAQDYFQRSEGAISFGSMSLPIPEMVAAGAAIIGCDLTPPRDDLGVSPAPLAMAKLLRLHATASDLTEHAPAVLFHPEAARGLEQALIGAIVNCLGTGAVHEDRSALRKHAMIMRRFHQRVEEACDQPLYIPELCKFIGASERTLRACCQEHLGISGKRNLMLRRMHLARKALRGGIPNHTSVTEIATQYGFWNFGRFSLEYKPVFAHRRSCTRPSKTTNAAKDDSMLPG